MAVKSSVVRGFLIGSVLTVALAACAGPHQRGGGMAAAFDKADTSGDGAIDRAEWTAAGRRDRGFDLLDTDANGTLTRSELAAGLKRLREHGSGAR